VVDVYHSGDDRRLQAPFLIMPHAVNPNAKPPGNWTFWKVSPLGQIAVKRNEAEAKLRTHGYYIQ